MAFTLQKLSPRFAGKENYFGTPANATINHSPWRKVFTPVSPQNHPFLPHALPQNHQVYPSFLTVPQVYGCFVAPSPTLCDTQLTDLASLESFAQPTWTRDVKQSVMTANVPNHCGLHPVQMLQTASK